MNEPLVVETQGTAADAPPAPALPSNGQSPAAPDMMQHAQTGYRNYATVPERETKQVVAEPPKTPEEPKTNLVTAKHEQDTHTHLLNNQPFSQALNYAFQSATLGGYSKYVEQVGIDLNSKPVSERLQPGYHNGDPVEAKAIRAAEESFSNKNALAALATDVAVTVGTMAIPGVGEAAAGKVLSGYQRIMARSAMIGGAASGV